LRTGAKVGAHPVILSQDARKILQHQLAAHGAGLKDFHFHDLRHHGATMALNAGFTAPIVMALGGWKTEKMMRRYAAVTDQTLRAAAEAVSGSCRAVAAPR
jgi:integrase